MPFERVAKVIVEYRPALAPLCAFVSDIDRRLSTRPGFAINQEERVDRMQFGSQLFDRFPVDQSEQIEAKTIDFILHYPALEHIDQITARHRGLGPKFITGSRTVPIAPIRAQAVIIPRYQSLETVDAPPSDRLQSVVEHHVQREPDAPVVGRREPPFDFGDSCGVARQTFGSCSSSTLYPQHPFSSNFSPPDPEIAINWPALTPSSSRCSAPVAIPIRSVKCLPS